MTKEKTQTKEEQKKERFEVVEIATQTGLAYRDNETNETLDQTGLLLKIANSIEELRKSVG